MGCCRCVRAAVKTSFKPGNGIHEALLADRKALVIVTGRLRRPYTLPRTFCPVSASFIVFNVAVFLTISGAAVWRIIIKLENSFLCNVFMK